MNVDNIINSMVNANINSVQSKTDTSNNFTEALKTESSKVKDTHTKNTSDKKDVTNDSNKKSVETKNEDKTEIKDKIEEVSEAIDEGVEEVIIEELAALMQMINIEVVDDSSLPLTIEVNNELKVDDAKMETSLNLEGNLDGLLDFTTSDEITENITTVINNLSDELGEEISDKLANDLEKITNLLETSDEKTVEITEIVDSIKSKLNEVDNVTEDSIDSNEETEESITKMIVTTNKTNVTEKSDDDILSKILNDTDGDVVINNTFAEGINKLEAQNVLNEQVSEVSNVVSRETMPADVIRNVKYMMNNNIQELTVKIHPKELGEMTIKLVAEDGVMKADIKAVSKEAYSLMSANLEEIKKSLSNENIQIKEVNISLYSEDTTYFSGQEGFDRRFSEEKGSYSNNDNAIEDNLYVQNEEIDNIDDTNGINLLA